MTPAGDIMAQVEHDINVLAAEMGLKGQLDTLAAHEVHLRSKIKHALSGKKRLERRLAQAGMFEFAHRKPQLVTEKLHEIATGGEKVLSENDILEIQTPRISGVYFLIARGRVKYVGQSVDVHNRVATHRREKQERFDRAVFIPVREALLLRVEALYIRLLRPEWNGTKGGSTEHLSLEAVLTAVGS